MKNAIRLFALFIIAVFLANPAAIKSGSNTCPSSGNKTVSSTNIRAIQVIVMGTSGNTGKVYVGGPTVTTSEGIYLNAGDTINFATQGNASAYDLSNIYFACTVSGDSIGFTYVQ